MSQIYLVGPFFPEEQIDRVSCIEKALEENKTVTGFYSSYHHQESNYELFSAGWAQEVYEKGMEELTNAEFVLTTLDFEHQTIDPGTVYELGVATMLKKTTIIVQEKTIPMNLMITQSPYTYLKSDQVVREYDFEKLPVETYVGEYLQKRKGCMSVILISGTIGTGKNSLVDMLAKEIDSKPFYENVEDNEALSFFYPNPEQYASLLRIFFLNKRFLAMKNALSNDDNVLDRSIYEDSLLLHLNVDLGRVTDIEVQQYDSLLDMMLDELDDVTPKKRPDLTVHIKVSLDTVLERIKKYGRNYEQLESDETLYTYYEILSTRYNQWYEDFDVCPKVQVDGDTFDSVGNPEDAKKAIRQIQEKLTEPEGKPVGKYSTDNQHAKGQELG